MAVVTGQAGGPGVITFIASAAVLAVYAPACAWVICYRVLRSPRIFLTVWRDGSAITAVMVLAFGAWSAAAGFGASAAVAFAIWWHRRRKDRRKAARTIGARARARIAAMVTTLRERSQPRRSAWEPT